MQFFTLFIRTNQAIPAIAGIRPGAIAPAPIAGLSMSLRTSPLTLDQALQREQTRRVLDRVEARIAAKSAQATRRPARLWHRLEAQGGSRPTVRRHESS